MVDTKHSKGTSKLIWPDECETIVKLGPLLLAGMSENRPTLHRFLRATNDSAIDSGSDDSTLNAKLLIKMRSEHSQSLQKQSVEVANIHNKKLYDDLIIAAMAHTNKSNKDQHLNSDGQREKVHDQKDSVPQFRTVLDQTQKKRVLQDSMYTYDIQRSNKIFSKNIQSSSIQSNRELFVDDRFFTKSYYNRKDEKDIYSKPPNMRRVFKDGMEESEMVANQSWLSTWEPTNNFINESLNKTSLKLPQITKAKTSAPTSANKSSKKPDLETPQKIKDSICPYQLPKRQEYKPLDGEFVARLVESQTGHVAHRHRKMRPTLGVSKLQKKTRLIHIGPSTKHSNHNELNEDADDLDLALQISNLSFEEKSFIQDLSNLTDRLELSSIRAKNKRKKRSSSFFRKLQTNVEKIVEMELSDNITDILRSQMERFLTACQKHEIFLETISNDYNPWEKGIPEIPT